MPPKTQARGSDNSGTRAKREPNKTQAELDRAINARPENQRVMVLLPNGHLRKMTPDAWEILQRTLEAIRNG